MTTEAAPAEDELKEAQGLKTRVELVALLQLVMDDAMATAEGSFDNMVKQLRVLNSEVELNTTGMWLHYYVVDRKIMVPEFLKNVVDVPVGESSRQEPVVEEGPQPDV